jgi:hypothetical protein
MRKDCKSFLRLLQSVRFKIQIKGDSDTDIRLCQTHDHRLEYFNSSQITTREAK